MTEFEKIYEAYFGDVFRYLKGLTGNESLAEELTSETFFKALRSLKHFRGGCDVRVWLCQIGKNCYYSYLKKHRRREETAQPEILETLPDGEASLEERLIDQSEAQRIHRLLHALPEPYKEVFMLRTFGELSFSQIGEIFDHTENWACVTYHRARNKIRKEMEDFP